MMTNPPPPANQRRTTAELLRDALEWIVAHPEGVFKTNLNAVVSNDSVSGLVEIFKVLQQYPRVKIRKVGRGEKLVPIMGSTKFSTSVDTIHSPEKHQSDVTPLDPDEVFGILYNLDPGVELEETLREFATQDPRYQKYLDAYLWDYEHFRQLLVTDFSFLT